MISIFNRVKLKLDKKLLKISCYAFAVIALSIIVDKILSNTYNLSLYVSNLKSYIFQVFSPFVYGFFIAYFLNPLVRFFENKLFSKSNFFNNKAKTSRGLSIMLSYAIVLGCIIWMLIFFVPDIAESVATFANNLPANLRELKTRTLELLSEYDMIYIDQIYTAFEQLNDRFINISRDLPQIIETVIGSTFLAASTLVRVIMGVFISFYMLYEKENFAAGFKKTVYASISDTKADKFFNNSRRINNIFERFIVGKGLDSLIIGILCFIVTSLFKLPYAGLISVIVGVTNMIPYFGPFIGGIPAVLIILIVLPNKAFLMFMIILIIQQFDGNFLGPKILGASIGISPIWIILSIIVGGAVAGPLGMFLGVPIFGSLRLFFNEHIDRKYKEKYTSSPVVEETFENDSVKSTE